MHDLGRHLAELKAEIGSTLADAREAAGYDQESVADQAGVSQTYVSKVESGVVS